MENTLYRRSNTLKYFGRMALGTTQECCSSAQFLCFSDGKSPGPAFLFMQCCLDPLLNTKRAHGHSFQRTSDRALVSCANTVFIPTKKSISRTVAVNTVRSLQSAKRSVKNHVLQMSHTFAHREVFLGSREIVPARGINVPFHSGRNLIGIQTSIFRLIVGTSGPHSAQNRLQAFAGIGEGIFRPFQSASK